MHRTSITVVLATLIGVGLAGCVSDEPAWRGTWTVDAPGIRIEAAPGALSTITGTSAEATVMLPPHSLVLRDGRFHWQDSVEVFDDEVVTFLPPPFRDELALMVNGDPLRIAVERDDHDRFLDGANVVEGLRFQQWNFPDRNPGTAAYAASLDWAAGEFESMGYDVEIDPYGTRDAPQAVCPPVPVSGRQACPASLANVVATKHGSDPAGAIHIVGGHYDIVPQVTYGALDNTAGSMTVMEIARGFQDVETTDTYKFALWGGEESGLLGSASWLATHPDLLPRIALYWNLDMPGITWPAPLAGPQPIDVMTGAGPLCAGPGADVICDLDALAAPNLAMQTWGETLFHDWVGVPAEGATHGQVLRDGGLSDYGPFAAAMVPTFFTTIQGPTLVRLHTETDTLQNMSKQALWGIEFDIDADGWLDPADRLAGEAALARSFEPYLWAVWYHFVLADQGMWDPPAFPLAATPG